MNRRLALAASAALVVVVMLLTLWPLPEQAYRSSLSPLDCLVCGDQGVQDIIQNVIMLLPLGLMLGLAGVRPRTAALAGFLLAAFVETMQYAIVPGRDASLSDVATNTAGAFLGALLAPHLPTLWRPDPGAARRLVMGAVVAWAAAWLFGAWALQGNAGQGHWRGRFPGDLPDAPALRGDAMRASIDGAALQLAPADLPPEVEAAFARDSFALEVTVRPAPPAADRENVVTIIDTHPGSGNGNLVMTLNRVGVRALLSFRLNAARAMLRIPSFSFGPAFGATAGDSVHFRVTRHGGVLAGVAERSGQVVSVSYRLGPELLWPVLIPRTPHPGLGWIVETFLWGAAILGLAGYWAGRARATSAVLATAAIAIAIQAITPRLFAVAGQSSLGWAMLMTGFCLGVLAGVRSARGARPLQTPS